jgi:ABC-2 type transport system permease protein
MIAQPSSLGPLELNNVVEAIKKGEPAVIFEDPLPIVMSQAVGTSEPKPPMGGMMGMGGQPQPKGDIEALWKALGIQVTASDTAAAARGQVPPAVLVWQNFNPYPKLQGLPGVGAELIFVRDDAKGEERSFNPDEPVVAGMEELLVPFATGVSQAIGGTTEFTSLVNTVPGISGTLELSEFQMDQGDPVALEQKRKPTPERGFVLAAWIRGEGAEDAKTDSKEKKAESEKAEGEAADASTEKPGERPINVIYVTDMDMLHAEFMRWRNQPDTEMNFRFDNVSFVLNLVDGVAGDDRFLEIRKRKTRHSTLRAIEYKVAKAREREAKHTNKFLKEYKDGEKKAEAEQQKNVAEFKKVVDDLRRRQEAGEEVDPNELIEKMQALAIKEETEKRRADVEKNRLAIERDKELAKIRRERDREVRSLQNQQKLIATFILPFPLIVGGIVWTLRRMREREGVSRTRMKWS